jgi:hypothetical protein
MSCMRAAVLLSISLVASLAHAGELSLNASAAVAMPVGSPALRLEEPAITVAHHQRFHGIVMRNAGIVATVVGTLFTVIGAVVFESSICLNEGSPCPNNNGSAIAGITMLAAGQGATLAGITLWAIGQRRKDDAEAKILSLTPSGVRLTF